MHKATRFEGGFNKTANKGKRSDIGVSKIGSTGMWHDINHWDRSSLTRSRMRQMRQQKKKTLHGQLNGDVQEELQVWLTHPSKATAFSCYDLIGTRAKRDMDLKRNEPLAWNC